MVQVISSNLRFLLADDHLMIRGGLKTFIESAYPGAVTLEAANGLSVMETCAAELFDLVILDMVMPGNDSLRLIADLLTRRPGLAILVYSMVSEDLYGTRVFEAGAKGFLSKEASLDELSKAVSELLAGKTYASADLQQLLAEKWTAHGKNPLGNLSARELQVVPYLTRGLSPRDIGTSLGLAASTIGTLKANIFRKLGVRNLFSLREIVEQAGITA